MKIILLDKIQRLGEIGDIVEVNSGYARNFLIPKGKALPSGDRASKELKHRLYHLKKLREGKIKLEENFAKEVGWVNFLGNCTAHWVKMETAKKMKKFGLLDSWVVRQFNRTSYSTSGKTSRRKE